MFPSWLLTVFFFGLNGKISEAMKLRVDVSVGLAESVCQVVEQAKGGSVPTIELKKSNNVIPQDEDNCFVWRWTRCDHNAQQPCSDWEKSSCPGTQSLEDKLAALMKSQGFCDIFQCGWTIDELHENWGYNPVLVRKFSPDKPPSDELYEPGSMLDFPAPTTDVK